MTAQVVAVKPGTTAPEVGRVAFDVAFPQRAMFGAWQKLLRGFAGVDWNSYFIGSSRATALKAISLCAATYRPGVFPMQKLSCAWQSVIFDNGVI